MVVREEKLQKQMYELSQIESDCMDQYRRLCRWNLDVTINEKNPFELLDAFERGTTGERYKDIRQELLERWSNRI